MDLYAASLLQNEKQELSCYVFLYLGMQIILTLGLKEWTVYRIKPYLPSKVVSIWWWNFFVDAGSSFFFSPKYTMCTWKHSLSNTCAERTKKMELELKLEIMYIHSLHLWPQQVLLRHGDSVEVNKEQEPQESSFFLHISSLFSFWNPSKKWKTRKLWRFSAGIVYTLKASHHCICKL